MAYPAVRPPEAVLILPMAAVTLQFVHLPILGDYFSRKMDKMDWRLQSDEIDDLERPFRRYRRESMDWYNARDDTHTFLRLDKHPDVYPCEHDFVMPLSLLSFRPLSRIKNLVGIEQ